MIFMAGVLMVLTPFILAAFKHGIDEDAVLRHLMELPIHQMHLINAWVIAGMFLMNFGVMMP